jgi:hypothetical protein
VDAHAAASVGVPQHACAAAAACCCGPCCCIPCQVSENEDSLLLILVLGCSAIVVVLGLPI